MPLSSSSPCFSLSYSGLLPRSQGAGPSPGANSVASWQWLPLSFSNQSTPSSFLIASLHGNPRGKIQVWGYILCPLLGLNLAEVFSPKVECHLVPDGMVWVGGPPRSGARSIVVGESSPALASGSEPWVTDPWLGGVGLCLEQGATSLGLEATVVLADVSPDPAFRDGIVRHPCSCHLAVQPGGGAHPSGLPLPHL